MDSPWTGREAELNRRLRERAEANAGVLTVASLASLDLTRKMIDGRLRSGLLVSVLRGVFALPGTKLTEKGRWLAAVTAAGEGSCLSHQSALALHGLAREVGSIHVVRRSGGVPTGVRRSSPEFGIELRVHQTRSLPAEHRTVVDGIRTTSPERALLEFACEASASDLSKALSQGERERKLDWSVLGQLLASSNGQRGLRKLRRVVAEWDPVLADARSKPEEDFLAMLRRAGLPMPLVNIPIGPYIADFYWPVLNLVVELDPWGTHRGRESFHRDHRKSVEIEARGIRVIRFTWDDLYRYEQRTTRELGAIIEQQARLHR